MVQEGFSVREKDSHEAPSISFEGLAISIKFDTEVSNLFQQEVLRLQEYSAIC